MVAIARTCYLSLSCGIPTYEYGQHGGSGFITKDNVADRLYYNFSGRTSTKKLTDELLSDWKAFYDDDNTEPFVYPIIIQPI